MLDARRAELIERVRLAKLTPLEAERMAEEQDLVRLPDGLNPVEWDPASKPMWTLLMSLAWALRRDIELVRQSWDAYANAGAQCWHRIAGSDGWELRPIPMPTLITLFLRTTDKDQFDKLKSGETSFLAIEATTTQFVDQLASGKIKAYGSRNPGGQVRQIDPYEWSMLAPHEDGASAVHRGTGDLAFYHIHIDRESLLICYPPAGVSDSETRVKGSTLHEAIIRTIACVYPNGLPAFRNQTLRNIAIWNAGIEAGFIDAKASQIPSDKTFSRIFKEIQKRQNVIIRAP